jgi:hydrogenase expression/formation protein HypE
MLITVEDEKEALRLLAQEGIKAAVIGEITEEGASLVSGDVEHQVEAPLRDEIYKMYDK